MAQRYWGAEISHGVPGLSELDRDKVRAECRAWLDWIDDLRVADAASYVGIASALVGRPCTIAAAWRAGDVSRFSVRFPDFPSPFLVGPHDLAPAR